MQCPLWRPWESVSACWQPAGHRRIAVRGPHLHETLLAGVPSPHDLLYPVTQRLHAQRSVPNLRKPPDTCCCLS